MTSFLSDHLPVRRLCLPLPPCSNMIGLTVHPFRMTIGQVSLPTVISAGSGHTHIVYQDRRWTGPPLSHCCWGLISYPRMQCSPLVTISAVIWPTAPLTRCPVRCAPSSYIWIKLELTRLHLFFFFTPVRDWSFSNEKTHHVVNS